MRTVLVTVLISGVFAATVGAQTSASPAIVQVGIYSSLEDGTMSASAYTTGQHAGDSFATVVYAAPCSKLGAGVKAPPDGATQAWRLAGRVLSMTTEEAVVQLDWQRILSEGQTVSGPAGSVQLTLWVGDRVTLDSATRPAAGVCKATLVGFEARFGPRRTVGLSAVGGATTGGSAVAGGGIGQRRPGGARATSAISGSGSGASASAGVTGGPIGTSMFDIDLWLVHGAPNRADEILHETIRATPSAAFTLAPIRIVTPQGALTVLVIGSVAIATDPTGGRQFVFTTDRKIMFIPSNRPSRDQAPEDEGSTKITTPMPGPDDVLSFEMPPLRLPNGSPAVADQFAIRVRITPVKRGR
jgi:hypothetical protein